MMKPWQNNLIGAIVILMAIGTLSLAIMKTEGVEKKAEIAEDHRVTKE